jgi:hypothetical protein
MVDDTPTIRKAQVSLPPPGGLSRWAVIGGSTNSTLSDPQTLSYGKRQQYAIYYEMYRQHPVVRAAIDKKAQFAVASGYTFKPADPKDRLNERKVTILKRFFRRSSGEQLLRLTYKDLDIYGESFWLIIRSIAEARTPIKAVRLNPRYMMPIVQEGVIIAWRYGPVSGQENSVTYPVDIILHFKLDDPENDTTGLFVFIERTDEPEASTSKVTLSFF